MLETLKRHSSNLPNFSIALAFATLSFAFNPTKEYDIVRHYQRIESLKGYSLSTVIENSHMGYYLFDSYAWLLNTLSLPRGLLPFIAVFISYILIFSIFTDIKLKYLYQYNVRSRALILIGFWLSLNFVALSTGIRFTLALSVMIYAIYHLYNYNKKILFIILSILSIYIHPFSLALLFLSLIGLIFNKFSNRFKILVYIAAVLFIINNTSKIDLNNLIIEPLKMLGFYSETYFSGSRGIGGPALSFMGKLHATYLPNLTIILGIMYLLLTKPRHNNPLYLLLCLTALYLGIFAAYFTFYGRMTSFFTTMLLIYIVYDYINNKNKFTDFFLVAMVLSLILVSLSNVYVYYPDLISTAKEVLYKPFLFTLFGV